MVYISQVMFSGILMACLQCVLMVRGSCHYFSTKFKLTGYVCFLRLPFSPRTVYALFSQDRRVALAMISLLAAEVGSMPGMIHMTMPTAAGNMCMNPITVRDIALFGYVF